MSLQRVESFSDRISDYSSPNTPRAESVNPLASTRMSLFDEIMNDSRPQSLFLADHESGENPFVDLCSEEHKYAFNSPAAV